MLCQLPVPNVRADDGILPIDLRNVTTFGIWLTEQVVLHWHQKKSKLPIYAEASHVEPLMAFNFLVHLAIATRPFMHPTYFQGLRLVFSFIRSLDYKLELLQPMPEDGYYPFQKQQPIFILSILQRSIEV